MRIAHECTWSGRHIVTAYHQDPPRFTVRAQVYSDTSEAEARQRLLRTISERLSPSEHDWIISVGWDY